MNRVVQKIFLPDGIWYEFGSGKKYLGNKYYLNFYRDEDYPVFCKAGSIIVLSGDDSVENPVNLEIDIFNGDNGEYNLYEDDGISTSYSKGACVITNYTFEYTKQRYEFRVESKGNLGLVPDLRNYKIRFRNTNSANVSVSCGSNNVAAEVIKLGVDLLVIVNNVATGVGLKVVCTGNDLENSVVSVINDDIREILEDLEIATNLKVKIDAILFGDLSFKAKKRAIKKLSREKLEPKFINLFINLLNYVNSV